MQWLEVTIRTASGGVELLCAELSEAGFDSLMIDDSEEFQEFLETSQQYWDYVDNDLRKRMEGLSQVRLYLEEPSAETELVCLRELLAGLPAR